MTYNDLCEGFRTFSSRMATFPVDEMLTLALLIDTDGDGCISWDDFYAFCTLCDESQYNHVNTVHCYECLFTELLLAKTKETSSGLMLKKISETTSILRENNVSTMNILLQCLDSYESDLVVPSDSIDAIIFRLGDELECINKSSDNSLITNGQTTASPRTGPAPLTNKSKRQPQTSGSPFAKIVNSPIGYV